LLSAEDGEKRRLTSPPELSGDMAPAFSPDGLTLAFVRTAGYISSDIYLTPAGGGEAKRLTTDNQQIISLAWTANGREIVFFVEPRGRV
jgi:Tol biopolymer transport system component